MKFGNDYIYEKEEICERFNEYFISSILEDINQSEDESDVFINSNTDQFTFTTVEKRTFIRLLP
jgi:hypothetical protein